MLCSKGRNLRKNGVDVHGIIITIEHTSMKNQTPPTSTHGDENEPIEKKTKKELVLTFLQRNPFYRHAAWSVGIDETTLIRWRNEDKEFDAKCQAMRAENLSKRVNRASDEFILTHADPETFKKADKLEISGDPLIIIKSK